MITYLTVWLRGFYEVMRRKWDWEQNVVSTLESLHVGRSRAASETENILECLSDGILEVPFIIYCVQCPQ